MKNFYVALQIEENGKYYAYAEKISENDNLLAKLSIKNLVTANICETKKKAEEVTTLWNDSHKTNGRYMFSQPF